MEFTKDTKVIDIPIFTGKFAIIDTEKKFKYLAEKNCIEDDLPKWGESFGCVFTLDDPVTGGDFSVIAISDHKPGCIAHEAVHLAINIMEAKEIPSHKKTEEVLAYLVGYIVDEVTGEIHG